MHFRLRKNVVQLVRTTYNNKTKKPQTEVIGRLSLIKPVITDELHERLSLSEIAETEASISNQYKMTTLREELAALTLAETLSMANRWFLKQRNSETAAAAANLLPELQSLRKTLNSQNLLG